MFVTRYLDLIHPFNLYLIFMKIFFIASSAYIIYLMKVKYRPRHEIELDTLRLDVLLAVPAVLALLFHLKFTVVEILWSFSIFLEAIAILPQMFLLQRVGEAETITTHYIFALGAYRAFYILNWIYRYVGYLSNQLLLPGPCRYYCIHRGACADRSVPRLLLQYVPANNQYISQR